MGLTVHATGAHAAEMDLAIERKSPTDRVIALAGNPNVGKSTLFNFLTGMNQHTGNWPGKTVGSAQGRHHHTGIDYIFVDLPGTYSLMAHSAEEEVARDFICFGGADAAVVVCDATCLERNLNLVLQTIEITPRVIVCVNLMDEARKKGIEINLSLLEQRLGVPVVGTSARGGKGLRGMVERLHGVARYSPICTARVRYLSSIEQAISRLEPLLAAQVEGKLPSRWLALRLLDYDKTFYQSLTRFLGFDLLADANLQTALTEAQAILEQADITTEKLRDCIVSCIVLSAESICDRVVTHTTRGHSSFDRRLDRILTGRLTGIPVMLLLLGLVFWLTITGANYPSGLLSELLFGIGAHLSGLMLQFGAPAWLEGMLIQGVWRVLSWVVAVMLPPMAIFFPLFTLLEDFGYLPRIAFNLDHHFQKACACGKQALTMAMGFGCNAAGVVGCRIIDSPRERLIAILTNTFVPCNGRFPALITIITIFFVGGAEGITQNLLAALILTSVILLGVMMTFLTSRILSRTLLKGKPSSFTLELPPYRRPQIGKVIVRSLVDRTLFVLGRAAAVAAPAGLIIWLLANLNVGGVSLLAHCAAFLDPLARLMGLDGVILLAFILGFPANEIVLPIAIMAYLSTGSLIELESATALKTLLVANGWTWVTAVSFLLFCLLHWPCSTTCLTIRKETDGFKWTALSIAIPTAAGVFLCMTFHLFVHLVGLAP